MKMEWAGSEGMRGGFIWRWARVCGEVFVVWCECMRVGVGASRTDV